LYIPYQAMPDRKEIKCSSFSFCMTPDDMHIVYAEGDDYDNNIYSYNILTHKRWWIDTQVHGTIKEIYVNNCDIFYTVYGTTRESNIYQSSIPYADSRILLYYLLS